MKKTGEYSFEKGWYQLRQQDVQAAKEELMASLGVTTNMAFRNRLKGKHIPKITQVEAIEKVFAKYGIRKVWGELNDAN
jgi:hypothetical protein